VPDTRYRHLEMTEETSKVVLLYIYVFGNYVFGLKFGGSVSIAVRIYYEIYI